MSTHHLTLTRTKSEELPVFFRFQLDEEANYLAAFTAKDQPDEKAYIEKFTRFLSDPTIHMRTIKWQEVIVGSIAKFIMHNEAEITYWIDRKFWGQGIATTALKEFLTLEKTRPLFGRVAYDNYGSQKVLEKCGFIRIGQDRGFANARQMEIEEYIYTLAK